MNLMTILAMAPPPGSPGHEQSMAFMFGWFMVWSVGIAVLCYIIAKQKGRCAVLAAAVGLIPFINIFVLLYIAMASNKNILSKLDGILETLQSSKENGHSE